MGETEFWELVKQIDMVSVDAEDCATGVEPITNALSKSSPEKILNFHEIMSQKLFALDSEARCEVSCGSGDGFLYQRCYMIAQGLDNFQKALQSETHICGDFDWCESLLYVAREAWAKTQKTEWDFEASVSYETGSNAALWG